MKPATQQETADVIDQLLNMNPPLDEDTEDDTTVPITPISQQSVQTTQPSAPKLPKVEADTATDVKPQLLPRVLGTAIKIEHPSMSNTSTTTGVAPKKKVFKTVEYKLKRKFSCVKCTANFNSK